jgi:formiminotetrahydrofolate cyclodeaminase
MLTSRTVTEFLDELASSSPAPGGGSVAALAGAIGAALTSMVCNLTIAKKKYADVQEEIEAVLAKSEELRKKLTVLVEKDTEAFNAVMAAFGMAKSTEEEGMQRAAAIQQATRSATLVPLEVMSLCGDALSLSRAVAEKGNKNSASDVGVAALMFHAACGSAELNVRINLVSLKDEAFVQQTTEKARELTEKVKQLASETLLLVNRSINGA